MARRRQQLLEQQRSSSHRRRAAAPRGGRRRRAYAAPQTPRPLRSERRLLRPRRHAMRRPTTRLVATAALALLLWPVPVVGKWQQDAFWISFWVGPQVELGELDERFAEVSECNFTGYLGFNGAHKGSFTPNGARVAKEIELCDKHGLRCVPSLCDVECCEVPVNRSSVCLELGRTSPNFWGYQLLDEPQQAQGNGAAIGRYYCFVFVNPRPFRPLLLSATSIDSRRVRRETFPAVSAGRGRSARCDRRCCSSVSVPPACVAGRCYPCPM